MRKHKLIKSRLKFLKSKNNKKLLKLLEHQFKPILCCGESLAQREAGVTMDFIRMQLKLAFQGVSASDAAKVTIA